MLNSTRKLVVGGLLSALTIVLGMTPLGFIPVPTPAGSATTMHIPTILAALLEGPITGAFVGFIFGLNSFLRGGAFFVDPIIAFIPRLIVGPLAYFGFKVLNSGLRTHKVAVSLILGLMTGYGAWEGLTQVFGADIKIGFGVAIIIAVIAGSAFFHMTNERDIPVTIAAIIGTAVNTIGVLTLAVIRGWLPPGGAALVAVTHGIPEIIVASAITLVLYRAVIKFKRQGR